MTELEGPLSGQKESQKIAKKRKERKLFMGRCFLVKLGFSFAGACAIILLLEVCPQDFPAFFMGEQREKDNKGETEMEKFFIEGPSPVGR